MSTNKLLFSLPFFLLLLSLFQIICLSHGGDGESNTYHYVVTRSRQQQQLPTQEEIDQNLETSLAFFINGVAKGFQSDDKARVHKFMDANLEERSRDRRPRKVTHATVKSLLQHPILFEMLLVKMVVTGADYYINESDGQKVTLGQEVCSRNKVNFEFLKRMMSVLNVNQDDTEQLALLNQWNSALIKRVQEDSALDAPASRFLLSFLQHGCSVQNPNLLLRVFMDNGLLSHDLLVTLLSHPDFDANEKVHGFTLICTAVKNADATLFFSVASKMRSFGRCALKFQKEGHFDGTVLEYAEKLLTTNLLSEQQKSTIQNIIIPFLRTATTA